MSDLTPDEMALARAVDIATFPAERRIKAAQNGNQDSAYVGIPWRMMLELIAALETARPGWIERTREVMKRDKIDHRAGHGKATS